MSVFLGSLSGEANAERDHVERGFAAKPPEK